MKRHVYSFFFRCGTLIRERSLFNNHYISEKKKKKKKDSYKEIITIAFSNWKILYYGYVPM